MSTTRVCSCSQAVKVTKGFLISQPRETIEMPSSQHRLLVKNWGHCISSKQWGRTRKNKTQPKNRAKQMEEGGARGHKQKQLLAGSESSGSSLSVVSQKTSHSSPGEFLRNENAWALPRPTESGTLRWNPAICIWTNLWDNFWCSVQLDNHYYRGIPKYTPSPSFLHPQPEDCLTCLLISWEQAHIWAFFKNYIIN